MYLFTDTSNIPEVAGLYRAAIGTAADASFKVRTAHMNPLPVALASKSFTN
jgi:hypothetical protein